MTYFIGIDPGLSGAIAMYHPADDWLLVVDMPIHEVRAAGKTARTLDTALLADMLSARGDAKLAVIEAVHSMPKQGVASSFKFGFVAGAIQQAVACNKIPVHLVTPGQWKRHFNLSSDKDLSRKRASELLPKHARHWPLKKHDGRAEAALLALYGSKLT